MSRMSANDSWLQTAMYGLRGLAGIVPLTVNFHRGSRTCWNTQTFRKMYPTQ